jgi:hypothetical protein
MVRLLDSRARFVRESDLDPIPSGAQILSFAAGRKRSGFRLPGSKGGGWETPLNAMASQSSRPG